MVRLPHKRKSKLAHPFSRIETISKGVIDLERVGYIGTAPAELLDKYRLQKGDILFSHINSDDHLGKTALFELDDTLLLHGINLLLLRPNMDIINPRFLNYLCNHYRFSGDFISVAQHAVNQSSINQAKLRQISIPLPSLPEQERIVSRIEELFTDLDAGVAALERVRAGLKRYKASVLKAAMNGSLVNQELRIGEDLPDGWGWVTVEELAHSIQYGYTESATAECVGPKFLRITDIQNSQVDWRSVPYCKCSEANHKKYKLEFGDIVFARTGATTGKSFLITECPDAVFASYLIRLRLNDRVNVRFFYEFLNAPDYWAQITTVKQGSAQPGVNAAVLATLRLPLPPLDEQRRIVDAVEQRLSVVQEVELAVEAGLVRAERLRKSVLKSAFEGRLGDL